MLRFIIRCEQLHNYNQARTKDFYTIDSEVPELEEALKAGGFAEDYYRTDELIGVEIHQKQQTP